MLKEIVATYRFVLSNSQNTIERNQRMSELLLEGNACDYNFIIIPRSFVFMMSLIGCLSQDMMLAAMQEAGVSALRIGEMVEAGL